MIYFIVVYTTASDCELTTPNNLQGIPKGKWVCPWQTPWKVLRSVYITDNNTQKKVLLSVIYDNNTFF